MKKILNALSIASILFISSLHPIAYADFDKGMVAYKNKDYPTALREFTESANQGEPKAQYRLGLMYTKGEGLPKNAKEAMKWYQLAANQGDTSAQLSLSLVYARGEVVKTNFVLAYALAEIAARQLGDEKIKGYPNTLKGTLSPRQLREAQAIIREWKVGTPFPTHTKKLSCNRPAGSYFFPLMQLPSFPNVALLNLASILMHEFITNQDVCRY